ncbi:hypothetical protein [Deinococcus maricopensis]|uniref:Uncharacterized protein n=1 Tax=Deinococcus maricopensis (strain DSM 21211 / LMG 22137 / NRRL B-23946 / LB-34) TaxID=709986 RepID=E8U3U1_DEIML|nr:hypothetical protein [Deinococcus maricopensis]ADV68784.1 hypothetical protein Deima_3156 [Deinococcus maricopensis DSM 21211]
MDDLVRGADRQQQLRHIKAQLAASTLDLYEGRKTAAEHRAEVAHLLQQIRALKRTTEPERSAPA